jgi:hypothetical protein
MTENGFLESIMLLPKKPNFIGYLVDTDFFYRQLLEELNKLVEIDMEPYTSWDSSEEDNQFYFNIHEWNLNEDLGVDETDKLLQSLPFDWESPWEIAEYLMMKAYGIDEHTGVWMYATVRPYDTTQTEVQIGLPKSL